ncbi:MAG TPA: 2-C-methyl-D-erythritol 2,4-cyclodiphosphate synthase [Blastocatellia bacterium]|nr:2-C-methyl-D-erythritol 2,4-cyclodiphosphate synthase [Blastocatellia bacterium]
MSEAYRVGIGYDIHRLVPDRKLLLAGVRVPYTKGLLGHSDSDVLAHAVCDALLGAAALGDIGTHFPDNDPRWRGASSLDFLRHAVKLIGEKGYRVVNLDATVITELPKLKPYIPAMRQQLASVLEIAVESVSVKAKTNEGLDAVGRGEAMAAHAVVMIATR